MRGLVRRCLTWGSQHRCGVRVCGPPAPHTRDSGLVRFLGARPRLPGPQRQELRGLRSRHGDPFLCPGRCGQMRRVVQFMEGRAVHRRLSIRTPASSRWMQAAPPPVGTARRGQVDPPGEAHLCGEPLLGEKLPSGGEARSSESWAAGRARGRARCRSIVARRWVGASRGENAGQGRLWKLRRRKHALRRLPRSARRRFRSLRRQVLRQGTPRSGRGEPRRWPKDRGGRSSLLSLR